MRDFLFSVGVFDDDRPAPKLGPVRNVDETTPLAWQHYCPTCEAILVNPAADGNCKPCHAKRADIAAKTQARKDAAAKARLDVAAIVGNLCVHCGVRRRKFLSRTCGQRACERHE